MNLKNYSSTVEASRSMANIEDKLVAIGATSIQKSYKDGICTGIIFLIYDKKMQQTIPFNLKAQVTEAFDILWKEVKRPAKDTNDKIWKQANRTAWKVLSDWVEIQCSMILLGQAEPLQMFLPYVYDVKNQETYYDKVTSGKTKLLLS